MRPDPTGPFPGDTPSGTDADGTAPGASHPGGTAAGLPGSARPDTASDTLRTDGTYVSACEDDQASPGTTSTDGADPSTPAPVGATAGPAARPGRSRRPGRSAGRRVGGRAAGAGTVSGGGPDDQRLTLVMRVTFFVLLGTCLARFVQRHAEEPRVPWVVALAVLLAVLYAIGPAAADRAPLSRNRIPWRPVPRLAWLGAVVTAWAVVVLLRGWRSPCSMTRCAPCRPPPLTSSSRSSPSW